MNARGQEVNCTNGSGHKQDYGGYRCYIEDDGILLATFLVLTICTLHPPVALDGAGGDVETGETLVQALNTGGRNLTIEEPVWPLKTLEFLGSGTGTFRICFVGFIGA